MAQLETRAADNTQNLNWKTSIVDLLKLLKIDKAAVRRRVGGGSRPAILEGFGVGTHSRISNVEEPPMPTHAARDQVITPCAAALKKPARSSLVKAALARTPGKGNPKKFLALLATLPPGTMSAVQIDREIDEVRGDWGR